MAFIYYDPAAKKMTIKVHFFKSSSDSDIRQNNLAQKLTKQRLGHSAWHPSHERFCPAQLPPLTLRLIDNQ